jgi:hypothetical protein
MKMLLALAVCGALVYASIASAFTPVVTAPYAFSYYAVMHIRSFFCTRCGASDNRDGRGRPIHGGGTAYDPYFDNPNRH